MKLYHKSLKDIWLHQVLNCNELNRDVMKETYSGIKIVLKSDKTIDNFSERSVLKNLGRWLGLITIARNKPILMVSSLLTKPSQDALSTYLNPENTNLFCMGKDHCMVHHL